MALAALGSFTGLAQSLSLSEISGLYGLALPQSSAFLVAFYPEQFA